MNYIMYKIDYSQRSKEPSDLLDAFHAFLKASLEESEIWLAPANTQKGQYARANMSVDSV